MNFSVRGMTLCNMWILQGSFKTHIPVNSDHHHRSISVLFGLGFDQKYSIQWPRETLAAREPTSSHASAAFISRFMWTRVEIYCSLHLESFFIVVMVTPKEHTKSRCERISHTGASSVNSSPFFNMHTHI